MGVVRMISKAVVSDVMIAAHDAQMKHGPLTVDPVRACAILFRECGEAMDEALLETVPEKSIISSSRLQYLYEELAQVSATAMLMMENLIDQGVAHG